MNILQIAEEEGSQHRDCTGEISYSFHADELERFAARIREEEREHADKVLVETAKAGLGRAGMVRHEGG